MSNIFIEEKLENTDTQNRIVTQRGETTTVNISTFAVTEYMLF